MEVLFDAGSFVFLFVDSIDGIATLVSQLVYRVRGVYHYFLDILVLFFCQFNIECIQIVFVTLHSHYFAMYKKS